ncbi:hypothetical protein FVER53590_26174 [Fusarium verticillioides]|nr:hypothetical protein FVER53590_26174 [Fusarium verticillioides]
MEKTSSGIEQESDTAWKINAFYGSDRKSLEVKDVGTLTDNWEYVGPVETNWYDHIYDSLEFVRELDAKLDEEKVTAGTEAEDHCFVQLLGCALSELPGNVTHVRICKAAEPETFAAEVPVVKNNVFTDVNKLELQSLERGAGSEARGAGNFAAPVLHVIDIDEAEKVTA